jgi:hypothetical protein
VITPPAKPIDPVLVYLVDEGRHASLVLPRDDGTVVQYAYGQWAWYAMGKDEWWRAPLVLLVPSIGALGRRELSAPSSEDQLTNDLWAESIITLRIERTKVIDLLESLDARYQRDIDSKHENPTYNLAFVKDDEAYWMFHHCNSETVKWLRELDCKVSCTPLLAAYVLKD